MRTIKILIYLPFFSVFFAHGIAIEVIGTKTHNPIIIDQKDNIFAKLKDYLRGQKVKYNGNLWKISSRSKATTMKSNETISLSRNRTYFFGSPLVKETKTYIENHPQQSSISRKLNNHGRKVLGYGLLLLSMALSIHVLRQ